MDEEVDVEPTPELALASSVETDEELREAFESLEEEKVPKVTKNVQPDVKVSFG